MTFIIIHTNTIQSHSFYSIVGLCSRDGGTQNPIRFFQLKQNLINRAQPMLFYFELEKIKTQQHSNGCQWRRNGLEPNDQFHSRSGGGEASVWIQITWLLVYVQWTEPCCSRFPWNMCENSKNQIEGDALEWVTSRVAALHYPYEQLRIVSNGSRRPSLWQQRSLRHKIVYALRCAVALARFSCTFFTPIYKRSIGYLLFVFGSLRMDCPKVAMRREPRET